MQKDKGAKGCRMPMRARELYKSSKLSKDKGGGGGVVSCATWRVYARLQKRVQQACVVLLLERPVPDAEPWQVGRTQVGSHKP